MVLKRLVEVKVEWTLYCVHMEKNRILIHEAPNTTIAEFANTVDPDETAHNELSHQDLQCLLSSL